MKQNSLKGALLLGILSFQFGAFSQQSPKTYHPQETISYKSVPGPNGIIRCHTMEMDSVRRANNPNLPSLEQEEAALQKQIAIYKAQNQNGAKKTAYVIPVIFHIFTDGSGSENISASQVQAQIDQLNLDYGDQAGSPFAVSADCQVTFCLAAVDENGTPLAEPGIERITAYGQGPFSDTQFENTYKAATIWDPNNYFNVWVANLSGGLLGYAQFPSNTGLGGLNTNGGSANTDGVVILYNTVGSVASPFPGGAPYNLGRTLTHEAGHWLGLRHIWGDGGCSVDDYCDDTPKSDASNFGCPNTNSCTDSYTSSSPWWPTANPADMVENYMDYSDDNCMNTFTADQATRIQTVMSVGTRRATLGSSTACNLASNPNDIGVSGIVAPSGSLCGSSITPQITVTNYGTNAVTSFTLTYNIDGTGNQTYNWTGSLPVGQSTTITLGTMSTSGGGHTFNAFTTVPNGVADTDGSNDSDASSFTVVVGGQPITLTLDTDCYGEETVYQLFDSNSNLLYSGGNSNVTVPVTATQNTSASDPGAYPSETTITEVWCLSDGCYDFYIHDAYGDGINGSTVAGCNTDGNYTIEDGLGTVLGSMQAPNGAFGFGETINFCVAPPCSSTFTSTTVQETCNGNNNGQVSVAFTSGNSSNATYNIGTGAQSSGTFTGLSQGSYTVTIVDGDACTSYVSVTLGGPSALVGTTGSITPENSGNDGAININVSGGTPNYTYAWNGPGGFTAATQDLTGLAGGTYSVTITDANGCTTTLSNLYVQSNVGIEELANIEFNVYPNPSEGIFNVEVLGKATDAFQVLVVDIAGRVVAEQSVSESTFTVDLSTAAAGSYTMIIQTMKHTMTKRVVVK